MMLTNKSFQGLSAFALRPNQDVCLIHQYLEQSALANTFDDVEAYDRTCVDWR